MNLLAIAGVVSLDVGLAVPTVVVGSTEREMLEMKQTLDSTGEELARRVDWSALGLTTTVVGTGAAVVHNLPASFLRMISGQAVTVGGVSIRGGLSSEEFLSLTPVAGTARYYLVAGKTIQFWPYLANAVVATIQYQSAYWNTSSAAYVSDTDTALLPDQLMIKGAIARWRRQKGMDYPDYRDEYETAIQNFAMFDDNARSP